jgi:type IV pilus assembly protein PilB
MTFQLENFLVNNKFVSQEQLQKAQAERNRSRMPLIEALDYLKFTTKGSVIAALEKQFQAKYIELLNTTLVPDIVRLIPENIMKRYMVIALKLVKENNTLTVAMVDPTDVVASDSIAAATGCNIEAMLTTEDEFHATFEKYYLEIFVEKVVGEIKVEVPEEVLKDDIFRQVSQDTKETLVVNLVNSIITQSVRSRATDIHVEPQEKELLIRFRVDGLLSTVQVLPRSVQPILISRIKILAELDIANTRLPQDGQIRIISAGHDLDLRVSTMPGLYGEKVAIRLLEKSSFSFGLSQLGMPPEMQSTFEDHIFRPNGLILVCGPTGSGKSTTLYSTISRIRSPEKNILTIEDPIEYEVLAGSAREGGITQVQVNNKTGLTFAVALRSFMRQDPDIIMVGEIRDLETAEIAITASTLGRLVLSSLHTNSTIGSITRLINMGIQDYMVAHSVVCVVSQRLIRTLCPYCKQPYTVPKALLQRLGIKEGKSATLFREVGCAKCGNKGYLGRIGTFELLPITEPLRNLILDKASEDHLLAEARKTGFKTLAENTLALVLNGTTTVSEMMRVNPDN